MTPRLISEKVIASGIEEGDLKPYSKREFSKLKKEYLGQRLLKCDAKWANLPKYSDIDQIYGFGPVYIVVPEQISKYRNIEISPT